MSLRSNGSAQFEQTTPSNAQPPLWADNFDSDQHVQGVTESKTQFRDSELFRQNPEPAAEGLSFNNFNSLDQTSHRQDSEYSNAGQPAFDFFGDNNDAAENKGSYHVETPTNETIFDGDWGSFTPAPKAVHEMSDSAFVKNVASGDSGLHPPHEELNDMPPEIVQADAFGFEPFGMKNSQSNGSDLGMQTQQSLGQMQVEGSYENHLDKVQSNKKHSLENAVQPEEHALPVDSHPEHELRPGRLSSAVFAEAQEQLGEQRQSLRQKTKSLVSSNIKSLVSSITDLANSPEQSDPHSASQHPQIGSNLTESLIDSKHAETNFTYTISDHENQPQRTSIPNGQHGNQKSRTSLGDSGLHQSMARAEEELRRSAAERSKTPERLASQNVRAITDQAIGDIIRDTLTQQHIDSISASVKESEYSLYMESKTSLYSHGVNFMDLNRKPTAGSLDSANIPPNDAFLVNNNEGNSQFMKINKVDDLEAKNSQNGQTGDGTARLSRNGSKKVSFAKDMIVSYDPTESAALTVQRESLAGVVSPGKQIIERPIRQGNEAIAVLIPRTIDEAPVEKELQMTGDTLLGRQVIDVRQSGLANANSEVQENQGQPSEHEPISHQVHTTVNRAQNPDSFEADHQSQSNQGLKSSLGPDLPKLHEIQFSDQHVQTVQKSASNGSKNDSKVASPNHHQNTDKLEEQAVQNSEQPSSQQDSLDVEAKDAEINIPNDIHRKSGQRSSKIESGKNLLPEPTFVPQPPERLSEKKVTIPENDERLGETLQDMIAPFKARASNFQATIAKRLSNLEAEVPSATERRQSNDINKLLTPKYIDDKQTLNSENSIKSPVEIKKTISDLSYGTSGDLSPNVQTSPMDKWKTLEPNLFKVPMSDNQLASAGASPKPTLEPGFGGKVSDAQVKANQSQPVKVPFKKQSLTDKDSDEKVIMIADVEEVVRSPVKVQHAPSHVFTQPHSYAPPELNPSKLASANSNPVFLAQYSSNPVVRAAQSPSINPQQVVKSTRVQNCLFSNFYENMYHSPGDVSQVSINSQTSPTVIYGQAQSGQHGKVIVKGCNEQQAQNVPNLNVLKPNPPVTAKQTIVHSQPQAPPQTTSTEHRAEYSGSRSPDRQATNLPRFMNAYLAPPNIQMLHQPPQQKGEPAVKVYAAKPIGSEIEQSFSGNYGATQPNLQTTKIVSSGTSKSPELQRFKSGTVVRAVESSPQPQQTVINESFLAPHQRLANSAIEQQFKERSISPYRASQVKVQSISQTQTPHIRLYKDTTPTNAPSSTLYQPGVFIHNTVRQNSPSSFQYAQSTPGVPTNIIGQPNSTVYLASSPQLKSPPIQPQSTTYKVSSEPPLQTRIINSTSSIPQNQTYHISPATTYQTTFINSSRSPSRQGSQIASVAQQPVQFYNSAGISDAQKTVWLNATSPRTVQQPASNFKLSK